MSLAKVASKLVLAGYTGMSLELLAVFPKPKEVDTKTFKKSLLSYLGNFPEQQSRIQYATELWKALDPIAPYIKIKRIFKGKLPVFKVSNATELDAALKRSPKWEFYQKFPDRRAYITKKHATDEQRDDLVLVAQIRPENNTVEVFLYHIGALLRYHIKDYNYFTEAPIPRPKIDVKALEDFFQQDIGVTIPKEYKEFVKKYGGIELTNYYALSTPEVVIESWEVWVHLLNGGDFGDNVATPKGPVKADWWNKKWVPITEDGSGNSICLDYDPAPGGKKGQVIQMWHDDSERKVLAPSFKSWVRTLDLENTPER